MYSEHQKQLIYPLTEILITFYVKDYTAYIEIKQERYVNRLKNRLLGCVGGGGGGGGAL